MEDIRKIKNEVMPILGDRKRADRDRGSFIQNSCLPSKSPACKIPKSRKAYTRILKVSWIPTKKIWKKYYKNWN